MVTAIWRNWAGTAACAPAAVDRPRTEEEIVAAVVRGASAGQRVKVVGAGHSFTDIACTDGRQIRLDRYDRVLDARDGAVTVEAGIALGRLSDELAVRGLALENLGDIAYQSLAGAISTATHGTGARLGNLSTQVVAIRLVTPDGSILECSDDRDPAVFRAARVGLGALGVVSAVTLRCVPAFLLHAVEEPARLDAVLDRLDDHVDGNDHFEFFWFPHTDRALVKRNNRTDGPARPKRRTRAWFEDVLIENHAFGLLARLGRARPGWIPAIARRVGGLLSREEYVDRSDRVFASPRLVRFSEMEYAIPREAAPDAIGRLRAMIDERGFRISFPVEVRFVAADDAFLSPSHGRETCYIAVHVFERMPFDPYFRAVEAIMEALGGRPHWGKIHFQTHETLRDRYAEWDAFRAVREQLDPDHRFANSYLDRVLGPG